MHIEDFVLFGLLVAAGTVAVLMLPANPVAVTGLILKRASASRPSGQWSDHDFDVLTDGEVVGRIFKANAAPVGGR